MEGWKIGLIKGEWRSIANVTHVLEFSSPPRRLAEGGKNGPVTYFCFLILSPKAVHFGGRGGDFPFFLIHQFFSPASFF